MVACPLEWERHFLDPILDRVEDDLGALVDAQAPAGTEIAFASQDLFPHLKQRGHPWHRINAALTRLLARGVLERLDDMTKWSFGKDLHVRYATTRERWSAYMAQRRLPGDDIADVPAGPFLLLLSDQAITAELQRVVALNGGEREHRDLWWPRLQMQALHAKTVAALALAADDETRYSAEAVEHRVNALVVAQRALWSWPDAPPTDPSIAALTPQSPPWDCAAEEYLERCFQDLMNCRDPLSALAARAEVQRAATERTARKKLTTKSKLREPSKDAFVAYNLSVATGQTQVELARLLTQELRRPVTQGQVSRWVQEAKAWLKAQNILSDNASTGDQSCRAVDPKLLELGPPPKGAVPRQRRRRADD